MNSLRSVSRRNVLHEIITRLQSTTTSSQSSSIELEIPCRIERGPTDILKALESTVTRDPTASHYKYLDDPYLIPTSKALQRTYAMARESGKKTAMWLHKQHGQLFPKNVAVPEIKAFKPPTMYTDKSTASEEALMEEISVENVPDAIQIYHLLEGNVSVAAKQSLLELLCFTNSESQLPEDLIETRWHMRTWESNQNVWRSSPEVTELFDFLKAQDSATAAAAYNTMICGMAKYMNGARAWKLYKECQDAGIPVTLSSYNYLLKVVPSYSDDGKQLAEDLQRLCMTMAAQGIQPTVNTLNAALRSTLRIKHTESAQELFRIVFAEFKRLNVEPSLASYYYAIRLYSREGDASLDVFTDILHKLQGKHFVMRDKDDVRFFVTAMETVSQVYGKRDAAEMLHELLLTGNNYRFIGNNYNESCYFRAYLSIVLNSETFEDFFAVYDKLVPQVYIPELDLMLNIFDALESRPPAVIMEYLPQLWSQAVMFSLVDKVAKKALQMMREYCPRSDESPLQNQFAEAAWTVWTSLTEVQEKSRLRSFTVHAEVVGNILVLLMRGDQPEQFLEVLSFLSKQSNLVVGVLTNDQVEEAFEICVTQAYVDEAIDLIEYIAAAGFDDVVGKARTVYKTHDLTVSQQTKLTNLVRVEDLELDVEENK